MPGFNFQLPFFSKKKTDDQNQPSAEDRQLQKVKEFSQGLVTIQDIIAPEAIEVDFTYQKINSTYTRTLFVAGYPRSVPANWLGPLINYPHQINVSMFIYPVDSSEILDNLKRKITEMEAEIQSDIRAGKISNINTEVKLEDARYIREQLAKGAERFYQFGLYVTIQANSKEELDRVTKNIQSTLGSLLIVSKKTTLQMDEGFKTTLPMGSDKLMITRNMDTTSLATTFPFTSSELTMETGIMYGINEHNESLVIFDRFEMENANMVVFAKSGAGKSYTVKLEILRQMMFGVEVLVLDPEHEYEELVTTIGGAYINFSFGGHTKINPFDLSNVYEEGENELGQKIISLHGLLKVMLGEMTSTQEALLDRALVAAYKAKGITPDPATQTNEPPLMEDLYKALVGMENQEANDLSARLEKYITGSFRGIFDKPSNFDISEQLTIFSVKEIEESLRPVAMYMILDFIWTRVKKDLKKRILVIDEAWYFMKHQDSASFIHGMVKRARKYYLGVTTITQDVEDFLNNDFGKAIVTNASIQFLMKQSTASVPVLAETFYLSEGERQLLVTSDVGEGIFFAGQNHVALRVVASPEEHRIITSNPEEVLQMRALRKAQSVEEKIAQAMNSQQPNVSGQVKQALQGQSGQSSSQVPPTPQNSQENQQTQDTAEPNGSNVDSSDAGLKTYSRPAPQKSKKMEPIVPDTALKPSGEPESANSSSQQSTSQNNVQSTKLSDNDSQNTQPHKQFVRYSIDDYQPPQS